MRWWLVIMLLPMMAQAKDMPVNTDEWRLCAADSDCVLVKGLCEPTAVNAAYERAATTYYKKQGVDSSCANKFWVTKKKLARCRLSACESVAK